MAVRVRLLLIVAASVSSVVTQKVASPGSPASFASNMEAFPSYRLASTSLNVTSRVESELDCTFLCVRLAWCISYNFGKNVDGDNKHICEALSVHKYNNTANFQPNSDFKHFSVATPCSKEPCQNGGTCLPAYQTNDLQCVCSNPRKYKGRYCQVAVFPTTCQEAIDINGVTEDKAYPLLMLNFESVPVYCAIQELPGCGEGGWTLVMKTDGSKNTFGFGSAFWSNKEAYNIPGGSTGLDTEETKLPTYWSTPFTKLCVGMTVDSETRFIPLSKSGASLHALIADGKFRATSASRATWMSLVRDSRLQGHCNKEGFNVLKARLGIIANNEPNCATPDSLIGFGTATYPYQDTTCGVEVRYHSAGNLKKKAMGFIFVK